MGPSPHMKGAINIRGHQRVLNKAGWEEASAENTRRTKEWVTQFLRLLVGEKQECTMESLTKRSLIKILWFKTYYQRVGGQLVFGGKRTSHAGGAHWK